MSDTYDTLGDQSFEAASDGHDAGCCCCAASDDSVEVEYAAETWAPTTEVTYEPTYEAEAPVTYAAPVPEPVAYEPVSYESVAEVPAYEPMASPAPVVSFDPAPVVDPAAAIIGGAGTIGGGDPYGGMTIVDPSGNVVDPTALQPAQGFVGPSSPVFGHGFEMVPNPDAVVYPNQPTVPLHPSDDDTVDEITLRHQAVMTGLNDLARVNRPQT